MNISPISFGKKIPITQCQIRNRKTDSLEPAIIYEFDCNDESDADEIRKLGHGWKYNSAVAKDMDKKYQVARLYPQNDDSTFYVLENKDGKILGFGELEETDTDIYDIKYLESNSHNKYKFVGQNIIAAMAEDVLRKNGKALTVDNPDDDAYDYYAVECGFEDIYGYNLKMNRQQIIDYLDKTESKVGAPLINLKA